MAAGGVIALFLMAERHFIVYACILFIRSSVSRPLGRFHVLLLEARRCKHWGACTLLAMFFPRYVPRSGIAGSWGGSLCAFFFFYGTSILFSLVATATYIPSNHIGGLTDPFFTA